MSYIDGFVIPAPAGNKKVMEDPRMTALADMPFDGSRVIFGGFQPIFDVGA
jgi:uncharacterized protein YbaA (DUF1428 family)